ncbi:RNA polymerase sigma factor [Pedobacter sp. AW31-3R]|uniref:RNA polymerase sigma factor n=1 Tax=Pedobacter sp. AW31-3R TaxID=3445781 RepID=UPI003FA050F4
MDNQQDYWNSFVKGDRKCFSLLYDLHYESLMNYAKKFSADISFIEESVQDLFVKLWQNKSNLKQPENIKYYLFKALRNTILNKIKLSAKEVYVGAEADMLAFDLQMESTSADDSTEQWDYLSKKFMYKLTDHQKEAVYLFYVEDMNYKEIADLLNIKIGGTYKLLYRAMSGIKVQVKEFEKHGKIVCE